MEKLVVEFDVVKTVPRDYGYEEKFLAFKGEEIDYKAICKDGKFVAIVSRRYRLIPNEEVIKVCEEIAKKYGFEMEVKDEFPRVHIHLKREQENDGIMVHNSVDGSFALRVDYVLKVGKARTIVRTEEIRQIYRKHIGEIKATIENLEVMIQEILKHSKKIKTIFDELNKFLVKEHLDILEDLKEILPQKYVTTTLMAAKVQGSSITTLKDFYEHIAMKIWNSDTAMKRKIKLFQKLNRVVFMLIATK
jgi:hypothetical protein